MAGRQGRSPIAFADHLPCSSARIVNIQQLSHALLFKGDTISALRFGPHLPTFFSHTLDHFNLQLACLTSFMTHAMAATQRRRM